MACTTVFISFWFSSLSGLLFKRLFSAGARSWGSFFSSSWHLSKTAWPQDLEQVAVKSLYEDWLLPLYHSDIKYILVVPVYLPSFGQQCNNISPYSAVLVAQPRLGLPLLSVCAVPSMPKAYRTPSSAGQWVPWSERCWTLCAAGVPGLARVCPGRLLLPVCIPSSWPAAFPKPFGLLQEIWIFPPAAVEWDIFSARIHWLFHWCISGIGEGFWTHRCLHFSPHICVSRITIKTWPRSVVHCPFCLYIRKKTGLGKKSVSEPLLAVVWLKTDTFPWSTIKTH